MVIPKEQLKHFQRWRLTDFDAPAERLESATEPGLPASLPDLPTVQDELQPPPALPSAEEIEQVFEQAKTEGFQAGYAAGEEAGKQVLESSLATQSAQLASIVANFSQALSSLDQTVADQMLNLAVEMAEQMLRGKLSVNRDFLLPIVREAIGALPIHHAHISLRVHPDDYPMVKQGLGEHFFQGGNQLIEDTAILPGGCLLNAGASEIDATVETRWKRVLEPLGLSSEWMK